jgi:hypothetical protein
MKISNKTFAWIYGLAAIAAGANAYLELRLGNHNTMLAWLCAGGISCGALSAYLELIEKENEDNFPR